MKRHFAFILFVLLSAGSVDLFGQDGSVEVTGQVYDESGRLSLPYAHVLSSKWATTTNVDGYFKAPLERSDTMKISYVGFKDYIFSIPQDHEGSTYEITITMERDTIYLREAEVFFLPENEEEFKEAIIALNLTDKEYIYAERNINLLRRQLRIANYDKDEMDASENAQNYMAGPQPVSFNFIFDKLRNAMRKNKALPELDEINPSTFANQNNLVGISEEDQKAFADSIRTNRKDSTFYYILKNEEPPKENKRR